MIETIQKIVIYFPNKMKEILYKAESYAIMGACFEVYKQQGCGFLEGVYQECLAIEFESRGVPAVAQQQIPIKYKNLQLNQLLRADFVCYEKIILEIKALRRVTDEHRAQVLNYLNATQFRLGLLVNFGHHNGVQSERIVL